MKRTVLGGTVLVFVAVAAGAGYWFGQRQGMSANALPSVPSPAGAAAPASRGGIMVEASQVAVVSLPQGIVAVGSLRSDESVTVRPEVAGRISAILFKEGQRVAKGAPLVRLDASVIEAEVQQARANLTLAQAKHTRALDLQTKGFISGQAKDEAENNLRVSEAAVALAQAKLAKMELKAPFSGVIGLRVVSLGDYVKEGADVVNLEAIDPLKVDFRLPETTLAQLKVSQTLQLTLDALPGKTFDGTVFAINPLIDAAGRSVVIRAVVKNAGTVLRPGMFARVRLFTRSAQDSMVIPEQALIPEGNDQFVYRVVEGKALRTKVDIGQRRDGKVEIVRGLSPTDTIVTAGQLKIRDGVNVRIAQAKGVNNAPRAVDVPLAKADRS